ncbi:male-specific protein scotti [Drosophila sechellia]|uniref:Male-specific protein scotti n=1 Tax=Drosophila sechellia TaxID=7238 RepID=SOTI_DROSE|nr:male-specific protein scotti [Drosophila sechellia]B4HEN5.1 RecName: Full=Male-specific protein scotti [Drosophila sechellia]EDW42192.1 GM25856 [Drosophila sechellia]
MDVLHAHDLYDEQLIDRVGDAVNEDAGDDLDTLVDGQQQQQRVGFNRQMDILLDAPQEPPLGVFPAQGGPNGPPRLRKKRSFYTMTKPTPPCQSQEPEMCLLMASVTRAMRHVREDQRGEYFANYLVENMTSQNYPNGVGLPQHWGQL